MKGKLTAAQQRIMESIRLAEPRSDKNDFWHATKIEIDGTIYFPKDWRGCSIQATMRCLSEKGYITYEDHPRFGRCAWAITVMD